MTAKPTPPPTQPPTAPPALTVPPLPPAALVTTCTQPGIASASVPESAVAGNGTWTSVDLQLAPSERLWWTTLWSQSVGSATLRVYSNATLALDAHSSNRNGLRSQSFVVDVTINATNGSVAELRFFVPRVVGYAIDVDETLALSINVLGNTSCPLAAAAAAAASAAGASDESRQVVARITVSADVETVIAATRVATETVTSVALAVGGPAAAEQQQLVALSFYRCAGSQQQSVVQNIRLLAPAATNNDMRGIVFGNWILIAAVAVVQVSVAAILRARAPSDQTPFAAWVGALARAHFPSWWIKVVLITLQGSSLAAMSLMSNPNNPGDVVIGALAFALVLATAAGSYWFSRTALRPVATYCEYNFGALHASPNANSRRAIWVRRLPVVLLPRGRWFPGVARKLYGSYFTGLSRDAKPLVLLPFFGPLVMSVGAFASPSSEIGCQVMFAVLAVAQFGFALTLAVLRPFRSTVANVLTPMSICLLGVIISFSARTSVADDPTVRRALPIAMQIQLALTVLRIAHIVFVQVVEFFCLDVVPTTPKFSWGTQPAGFGSGEEGALDEAAKLLLLAEDATPTGSPSIRAAAANLPPRDDSLEDLLFGDGAATAPAATSVPPPPPLSPPPLANGGTVAAGSNAAAAAASAATQHSRQRAYEIDAFDLEMDAFL